MYFIILILFFAILLAFAIDRKIEDTIPAFVFAFLICLFGLALIKKPHHAFEASLVMFAAVWGFYIFKKKRLLPTLSQIKEKFTPVPVGLLSYLGILLIMWFAYSNHVVNNWDDFHYNATFARNMLTYGGMPTGWKNATSYKSYKPLMQMFYNLGFQATGGYNEPLMFRYKNFLLYTAVLPLFARADRVKGIIKKIATIAMAIILPYLFMYEIVDSLSMDAMMGLLAGYALILIVFTKERDWFCYVRIAIALIALVLVKSSAVMFVAICAAVWLLKEMFDCRDDSSEIEVRFEENSGSVVKAKQNFLGTVFNNIKTNRFWQKRFLIVVATGAATLGAWLSWKIFCERNGNVTFLNNILDDHLDSEGGLPWFTKSLIINGFKGLFTTSLNLGRFSFSLMAVVAVIAIAAIVMIRKGMLKRVDHWIYFVLFGAIIPYYMVLMYTYMYVFFEYEALALSSYDRYLGTYAVMILYFAYYQLTCQEEVYSYAMAGITAAFFLSLNFPYLHVGLYPPAYAVEKAKVISDRQEAEAEAAAVLPDDVDAKILLIVSNEVQTVYGRGLDLAMLPLVAEEVVFDEIDRPMTEELSERFETENVGYVYFSKRLTDETIADCGQFAEGGEVLAGTLYKYDEDTSLLEYVSDCR